MENDNTGNHGNHDETETKQEEFLLTNLLRSLNRKLLDGIIGVFRRAWYVIVHLFSKRMLHFFLQGVLLGVLLVVLLAVIFWPYLLLLVSPRLEENGIWPVVAFLWVLCIGVVGVWQGFKHGAKLRQRWKTWRDRRRTPTPPPLPPRR